MSGDWLNWFCKSAIALSLGSVTVLCGESKVSAQIIPDDTLGAESSVVTSDNIKGLESDRISGGAVRGKNLFHSFREFNIGEGKGGYFENPAAIENIFSRVTGSNPSNILGRLGVLEGNANLFFLNPNGIIFGDKASLDLKGSFLATTADSIVFPNDNQFSGTNPDAPPLLTVNVQQPIGLEFEGQETIARIENKSTAPAEGNLLEDTLFGLRVPDGKSLLLVGGDIAIDGGGLHAPDGRVELAGVSGSGTIGLSVDRNNLNLSFPEDLARADIFLTNEAFVNTSSDGGGEIKVWGEQVNLSEGSQIAATTLGAKAGKGLTVNASESVELSGTTADNRLSSGLFTQTGGTGDAGDLTINTKHLLVENGARVLAGTFSQGKAGNLTVNASETLQMIGATGVTPIGRKFSSRIGSDTGNWFGSRLYNSPLVSETSVTGEGGNVTILTKQLRLLEGAQIGATTRGNGDGGSLTVNASESVQLVGGRTDELVPSGLFSTAMGARGSAGKVIISTKRLLVENGAVVEVITGDGDGGSLTVNASESVRLIGRRQIIGDGFSTSISSALRTQTEGKGQAGDLTVHTQQLLIQGGAQISAGTFGKGDGGNLTVDASESVQLIGSPADGQFPTGLLNQAERGSTGRAGDLTITTGQLLIRDGAQVSASTFGDGDGGRLTVDASKSVQVIGSGFVDGILSGLFTQTVGTGDAGDQTITTKQLLIQDANNLAIAAGTFGEGNAGNITIETDTMSVINSQVGNIVFRKGGNAGNLTVRASESVEVSGKIVNNISNRNIENPAGLFAQVNTTGEGRGGNLTVETERLSVSNGGKVQVATFGQGDAGNLTIRASQVEVFDTPIGSRIVTGINAGIEIDPDETVIPPRGNGGDLTIETERLSVRNGAEVSVSTAGLGNAGRLGIQASESVEVVGTSPNGDFKSQISAEIKPEGTGSGGSLSLETRQLLIKDGAEVTVSSLGSGVAGNLQVQADSISLDNQGAIAAITRTGNGGDLTLKVQELLLLRRGSKISTTAGTDEAEGNGGNIIIDAPFIIAFPNEDSDITANAFEGNGGNITINTNGIFGLELRDEETPLSDITASSEFGQQGEVEINTSAVDPTRGLNNLPQEAVEAEVAQSCQTVGGQSTLEFFDVGRGGLPPTPEDLLSSEVVIAEWIPLDLGGNAIQEQTSEKSFAGNEIKNMTLLTTFLCQSNKIN